MWSSPLHHKVIFYPFPFVGVSVIIIFNAIWACLANATSEQKLDVLTLPSATEACLFQIKAAPSAWIQEWRCVSRPKTQLPAWSGDSNEQPNVYCEQQIFAVDCHAGQAIEHWLLEHSMESQKIHGPGINQPTKAELTKEKEQYVGIMKTNHEHWLLTLAAHLQQICVLFCFIIFSLVFIFPSPFHPSSVHPRTLWTLVLLQSFLFWTLHFRCTELVDSVPGNYHAVFCFTCFTQVFSLMFSPKHTIPPAFTSEVLLCLSNLVQRSGSLRLSSPSPQCYLLGQGHHLITFTVLSG